MAAFTEFLRRYSLPLGVILMFLLTWPINLANAGFIPVHIPFVVSLLIGYGIVVASLIMTALTLGKDGVIALLKRFLIWHVGWKWYLVALFLFPATILCGVLLNAAITHTALDFSTVFAHNIFGASASLPVFVVPFLIEDILTNGEEIGWRGYVLPRLQTKYNALVSSLIVGVIWVLWHLPRFLAPDNSSSFWLFLIKVPVEAVLYTWLYNNTKGSLLLVTLFHSAGNTAAVFLPVATTVSGENLGALIIQILLEILIAIVVVGSTGPARLSRTEQKQVQM